MSGKKGQRSKRPAIRTGYEPPALLDHADGRLRSVAAARDAVARMQEDLGGDLSAAKQMLIRRAAIMDLRLQQLEAEYLTTGQLDVAAYTALNNASLGVLRTLGIERRAKPVKRITEILAEQKP